MKSKKQKELNINIKLNTIYQTVLVGVILAACLMFALIIYSAALKKVFRAEIVTSMQEVSSQSVQIIQNEISGKLDLLVEIADRIGPMMAVDYTKTVDSLSESNERYKFKRMGIILPDGTAYTTDKNQLQLGERDYFIKSMEGNNVVSDTLIDIIGGEKIIVCSTPIYSDIKITGVLFATYSTEELEDELSISTFGGEGYSYIVNKEGDCIVNSSHPKSYQNLENIFRSLTDLDKYNIEKAEILKENITHRKEGFIKFNNQGSRYMYSSPLTINDWNVITVVSANVLDDKMNVVIGKTYSLSAVLIVIFLIILIYILHVQKKNRLEIMNIAYVDEITGGYSYAKFNHMISKTIKNTDRKIAFLNIDIDDFKFINDAFGYKEGDKLIRYIWGILFEWIEKGEIFAHQSADIFSVIIFYDTEEILFKRLDILCEQLQHYYICHENKFKIIPSVGVCEMTDKKQPPESFLDAARIARKTVKGKVDTFYAFYDKAIKENTFHDKEIEAHMHDALNNKEFIVYYQPKYNSVTQKIVGAEALVRWRKANGTIVPPDEFIPLFERNGFITALDSYVLETVCRYQKKLIESGFTPIPISVNISRMHIFDVDFVAKYTDILEKTGLPIDYIQLEITESAISDNQMLLMDVINRLHNAGFLILLDDFGTGYSSMMMLKDLSIDILKIDKSFVDNIGDNRGNKIIDGIISLAKSLDISLTAEGVEVEDQYEYLKLHGCESIQGYYFAKPMPEDEFEQLLSIKNNTISEV